MTHEEMFQACMIPILQHEGGLTEDKHDPGGDTNWGISLRYLKSMGLDLNHDGFVNDEDVIGLLKEGAEHIYQKYWWDKYHYANFTEFLVVAKVFDLAVNMGGMMAHKLLQIAINRSRMKPITVDGQLGQQTFFAANTIDGRQLRQQLRECAEHKYIQILADYPAMEWCRKGWMNRAAW